MNIIKLSETGFRKDGTPCALNAESISCVRVHGTTTYVILNNGTIIEIEGNYFNKIIKLISVSTNGSVSTLE